MTAPATRSARTDPAHRRGRVGCTVAGCPYTLENAGSLPAHLAMAHPEVPMDKVAPRRAAGSSPDGDDQRWLDERIAAIEDGIEAVLDIARNWTGGRNLARLHPDTSAQDYILARVTHPLGRGVVVPLLAESNWSNPQIAAVAGVDQSTVYRARVRFASANLEPVLGADNRITEPRGPRVVQAVVIDTPPVEEEPVVAPTAPPAGRTRDRLVANANRDRLTRGLAMVEGACAGLASLNFAALMTAATPDDRAAWGQQIADISSSLRAVRRGIERSADL